MSESADYGRPIGYIEGVASVLQRDYGITAGATTLGRNRHEIARHFNLGDTPEVAADELAEKEYGYRLVRTQIDRS